MESSNSSNLVNYATNEITNGNNVDKQVVKIDNSALKELRQLTGKTSTATVEEKATQSTAVPMEVHLPVDAHGQIQHVDNDILQLEQSLIEYEKEWMTR
jgi:hypothetical protein